MNRTATTKQLVGLLCSVAALVAAFFAGDNALLKSVLILVSGVVLWIGEVLPMGITGAAICFFLMLTNAVPSFAEAFLGFSNATTWFILAISVLNVIVANSQFGPMIYEFMIKRAGVDPKRLVLAFMVSGMVISSILNDVASVILMLSLLMPLIRTLRLKKGSNLAKDLVIGITAACNFGGFATPVSHTLNIIAMGMLEAQTGSGVNYAEWMLMGVPLSVAMTFIAWLSLVKVFPPEPINEKAVRDYMSQRGSVVLGAYDKKVIALVVLFPILCFLGSWIPVLSITNVALIYMVVLFLPGVSLLSWEDFRKNNTLDAFLMLGGILSVTEAIKRNGGDTLIVDLLNQSGLLNLHPLLLFLVMGVAIYLVLSFCPSAPAVLSIVLPTILVYSSTVGLNGLVPTFILATIGAGSFLLPLTPTAILTYQKGYYSFADFAKVGWLLSVVLIVGVVFWSYSVGSVLF
ncbi:SLC13 family permease [Adlercreutzia sp. ZJ473]|uniref:SLC13 family permease n=1 Tax=Adlercreutzia sp. ZJ473 TaxID=2722822 RepID=UPI001553B8D2|nr:SLC13 family permease [Adlercreutzia sp. ZJ473]